MTVKSAKKNKGSLHRRTSFAYVILTIAATFLFCWFIGIQIAEINGLKEQIREYKAAGGRKDLLDRSARVSKENERIKNENVRLQARLEVLESDMRELEKEKSELNGVLENLKSTDESKTKMLFSINDEKKELEEKLGKQEELTKKIEDLEEKEKTSAGKIAALLKEKEELEKTTVRLKLEIAKLKSRNQNRREPVPPVNTYTNVYTPEPTESPKSLEEVHKGDSQAMVRQILGEPDSIDRLDWGEYWYYGEVNKIEFNRDGRVTGSDGIKINPKRR